MSKIAIITDTHFGLKNGDEKWLNSQLRFFREEFFPYLEKNNITDIIHLGDLFNDRETTNNRVADEVYRLFEKDFANYNSHIIVGNHDSYFKTRTDISITRFLDSFPHVNRISETTLIKIDGKEILLVPWQPDWEKFAEDVNNKNTNCEITMGHFPISGFLMNNKMASPHGVKPELFFKNFKRTFSGHYHMRSEKTRDGNKIIYPGNTYHLTRHDIGNERGFCIFDTNTMKHKFIESKKTIKYISSIYPDKLTKKDIEGNIVDIHVKYDADYNEKELLQYIDSLEKYSPLESFNIKGEIITEAQEDYIDDYSSTIDLIKGYVDLQDNINDKDSVNNIIEEVHNKCLKGAN